MVTQTEVRRAALHRPIFRPRGGQVYVCVRSVKLASNDVRPAGSELSIAELRTHHLRSLYQRRMIGVKDTPWTDLMLDLWESKGGDVIVEDSPATETVEVETLVLAPDDLEEAPDEGDSEEEIPTEENTAPDDLEEAPDEEPDEDETGEE